MKRINKVIMYVYRDNNRKKEFFALHRKKGDAVVLTGHVENESLEQAAEREITEELKIEPKNVINLNMSVFVGIKENNECGDEHAFLIEIPNKEVRFLDGREEHKWHSLEELYNVLTYPNQKEPLDKIKNYFNRNN